MEGTPSLPVQDAGGSSRALALGPKARSVWGALQPTPIERMYAPLRPLLAAEIIVTYFRVRQHMRQPDIREVLSAIRNREARSVSRLEEGSIEARLVVARLATAVKRTLWILPTDSRCLVQSLVLSWILSARAIPSTLVIGAHASPEFAAHAWVEYCGVAALPTNGFAGSRLLEI